MLRGPSKDILNEIERNLQDAMCVARNVFFNPLLAPGGGATEMAISVKLSENSKTLEGIEQWPYKSIAESLEIIPRTLIQNCGGNSIKVLTQLRVNIVPFFFVTELCSQITLLISQMKIYYIFPLLKFRLSIKQFI